MIGAESKYEPNSYYRPWLELNVGRQGIDWDWELYELSLDLVIVYFHLSEHCLLFELKF